MNLHEASALLERFVEACPELEGKTFLIMEMVLPHSVETKGYELIIKTGSKPLKDATLDRLRDIASNENFKLGETATSVMIYEPMPPEHDH